MYYKKRKMINKKAQGLSITTIILIILGVIVLVMLIVGFTMGWGNLKDWIAPSNNVQQIVSQCEIACATGGKYDFCFAKRELKSEDEKLEEVSCYTLSKKRSQYGVGDCSAISCGIYDDAVIASEKCEELELEDEEKVFYIGTKVEITEETCKNLK